MDSLGVEGHVLFSVVAEGVDASEGSSESLGSGLEIVSESAEIIGVPSEELIRAVEVSGLSGIGLEVSVVVASLAPFVDEEDVVVKGGDGLGNSASSSGVVDEVSGGSGLEFSSSGEDVGSSLTSDVGAFVSVSLESIVARALLGAISLVGAGGIGGAWVGAGTDIGPAEVGSVHISAEVETTVASARVVVLVVGAGGVSLAWVLSAGVNEASDSITVETIVAIARPLGGSVDVWELDGAGGIGGAVIGAAASVWDAVGSITSVVKEASAAGADGGTGVVGAVGVVSAWVFGAGIEVASISESGGVTVSIELFDGFVVVVVVASARGSTISGDAAGGVFLAGGVLARVVDASTELSEAIGVEIEVTFSASALEVPASAVGAVSVFTACLPVGDVILSDDVVVLLLQDLSDGGGASAGVLSLQKIIVTLAGGGGKGNNGTQKLHFFSF